MSHNLGGLTDTVTDFIATDITSTTITLTWSPPIAVVPMNYEITCQCRRLCELLLGQTEIDASVIAPHYSTDITPYTECNFSLIGVYGAEFVYLTTLYTATTLYAGMLLFIYTSNFFLFKQLPLYQSVILLSHQWSQCQ